MAEQGNRKDEAVMQADPMVPGTAQIRKIAGYMSSMELLEMAAHLAEGGYDKKLFSVLSRVFTEKKGFDHILQDGMKEKVQRILSADVPAELKMQEFTSFELPRELAPDMETARALVKACSPKRLNIAAFFIAAYDYEIEGYSMIVDNRALMKIFATSVKAEPSPKQPKLASTKAEPLLLMYEAIIEHEQKEYITGVTRVIRNAARKFSYSDTSLVRRVTEKVFASRQVFYTSKILYCLAFCVPEDCLPSRRDMYKILKISVNYDERATKEFAKRYHNDFDVSESALCHYYLSNRKAEKEKPLVVKFACHVVRVESDDERRKLLHLAFKRGGMFRMYAGCMQDGGVNEEKQRRFRYSEEDIAWVKTLPGLCEDTKS